METFIKMEERTNTQQREMEEKMTKQQMEFEMKLRQLDAEREEKRRREERQFQLQMMQMQMQMFGGIVNQGFSGGYMNNHSVYNDNQAGPSSMPNAMPMQYQSTCTRDQYSTTPPYVQQVFNIPRIHIYRPTLQLIMMNNMMSSKTLLYFEN